MIYEYKHTRMGKKRFVSFALSLLLMLGLVPSTVFAASENGYNLATITNRPYDGTPTVTVTDMVFSSAFDTDDVSADAVGTLSSANAGTYTSANISNIQPKGADIDYYDFPTTMDNIPTNVMISKVDPAIDLSVQPMENSYGGQELLVTAKITNNFNYNDGLPSAEQFSLTAINATLKTGTNIVRNENEYSATFVTNSNIIGQKVTITANVLDSAVNYNALSSPKTKTLNIIENPNELWINGADISIAENNTIACGSGTAIYNLQTNTLTLTNATIDIAHNGIGISKRGDSNAGNKLTIELIGKNTITTNNVNQIHSGIYTMGCLDIKGSGSLSVTTATNSASYITTGIYAWSGLTVEDATITLKDTSTYTAGNSTGIDVNQFNSSFSGKNATISTNGLKTGINVPSGNISINNCRITTNNANRGISGGNEIDHFIINDSSLDLTVSGENSLGLLNGHNIQLNHSNITIISETSNAIYTDGPITITNNSNLNVTGFYPALFSTSDTTISDSTVKATSTNDSSIYSKANIVINGASDITAKGYLSGVNANGNIIVNNGKVTATSTHDMGIYLRGIFTVNGGEIYAKGASNYAAIGARYERQATDTKPVENIVIHNNYAETSGGKISASDWYNGTSNGTPYIRNWTSIIAEGDNNALSSDRSNALNEITIRIKKADYSKVKEAVTKANTLQKEEYKDFSAVTAAINAVIYNKDITEQSVVDEYAIAIERAITSLEKKSETSPTSPIITKGNHQNIEQGSAATFTSSANYKDFLKVLIDGNEISAEHYTVTEGSTIVTLTPNYMKTLSTGKHTISIVSTTGQANADFLVVSAGSISNKFTDSQGTKTPSTGDSNSSLVLVFLLLLSGSTLLCQTISKKRKRKKQK